MSAAVKCVACNDTGCVGDYIDCISCGAAVERINFMAGLSRIARTQAMRDELWATYVAGKAAGAAQAVPAWKPLADTEWMNIVNHDHAYVFWSKDDAVHEAVKRTEAKLKELNAAHKAT